MELKKEAIKLFGEYPHTLRWKCPYCGWLNWGFPSLESCTRCNKTSSIRTCPKCDTGLISEPENEHPEVIMFRCPKCNKWWDRNGFYKHT